MTRIRRLSAGELQFFDPELRIFSANRRTIGFDRPFPRSDGGIAAPIIFFFRKMLFRI